MACKYALCGCDKHFSDSTYVPSPSALKKLMILEVITGLLLYIPYVIIHSKKKTFYILYTFFKR